MVARWFLHYNQSYRIWKLYRDGLLERATAEGRIAEHCDVGNFRALLPLYKVYSPYLKAKNALSARLQGIA
jgi:hypothetical protein